VPRIAAASAQAIPVRQEINLTAIRTAKNGRAIASVVLRRGTPEDANDCGRIIYEAFKSIADQHNFAPDFSSVEAATALAAALLSHPHFYGVVAEVDSRIVGSNFLDERSVIAGIGPITVDPSSMNRTIGRQLMLDVMERASREKFPGVRLVQIAYHYRSLSLYTKLGFETRETLSAMYGPTLNAAIPEHPVRAATGNDVEACDILCRSIHGHDRHGELLDAIAQGTASVVEHLGDISGYSTGIGWGSHAIGQTNEDLKALIAAAPAFQAPGFLVPTRNSELMRWCLDRGLRIATQATLMTIGLYNEPMGRYLPSILY
jgi:predicted N-acetyltransferase YhbS